MSGKHNVEIGAMYPQKSKWQKELSLGRLDASVD